MPTKSLRTLVENAHKNSVSVQRHRISREDAARVKEAEKIGGQQEGLKVLLKVLLGRCRMIPCAMLGAAPELGRAFTRQS